MNFKNISRISIFTLFLIYSSIAFAANISVNKAINNDYNAKLSLYKTLSLSSKTNSYTKKLQIKLAKIKVLAGNKYRAYNFGSAGTAQQKQSYYALIIKYENMALKNINDPTPANASRASNSKTILDNFQKNFKTGDNSTVAKRHQNMLSQQASMINSGIIGNEIKSRVIYTYLVALYEGGDNFLKNAILSDMGQLVYKLVKTLLAIEFIILVTMVWLKKKASFDVLARILLVTFCTSLVFATNGIYIMEWIVNPLLKGFFGLATWIMNQATYSTDVTYLQDLKYPFFGGTIAIEAQVVAAISMSDRIYDMIVGNSWKDLPKAVMFGVLYLGGFAALAFAFARNFAANLFQFYIYMAISPIMLLLPLFGWGKASFNAWVKELFRTLTIPVLTAVAMALTTNILNETTVKFQVMMNSGGEIPYAMLFALIFTVWISFLIVNQIGSMGAFITGGQSPQLGSATTQAITALSTSVMAAKSMGAFAGKGSSGIIGMGKAMYDKQHQGLEGFKKFDKVQ